MSKTIMITGAGSGFGCDTAETLFRSDHTVSASMRNAQGSGVTEAFTAEQVKVNFDTNVIGLRRVTRPVLHSMRQKRDGLIINVGSVLGRVTFPFLGIYGATNSAVEALTDSPGLGSAISKQSPD